MSRSLKITLIELPATVDGRLDGPLAKDIYCLLRYPARGTPQLAANLRAAGFDDVVTINPLYNEHFGSRREGQLTEAERRRLVESDVVGISSITRTAPQSYELARLVKAANPTVVVIHGGPHPTALPEEALASGDVVATHEGDVSIVEICERVREDRLAPHLADVNGIAFRRADEAGGEPGTASLDGTGAITYTPPRPFLTSEELSELPLPIFTEGELRHTTHNVINTSRGCPYECEFCSVIENFGRAFRFLDDDRVLDHLRYVTGLNDHYIFFGDDIFTAIPARTKRLMDRILNEGLRMPRWAAQVRVESGRDRELLRLMRRAGCDYVFIGFESINPATLKLYNKHATVAKNELAVARYREAGIKVHGMFVLGSDADTEETVHETVKWAKKMRLDTAQFFALTAVPGPPLTRRLREEGRVITDEWHLFDAHVAVVDAKTISPYRLQRSVFDAALRFYSYTEAVKRLVVGPHRLFNFSVRVYGKRLAKQIIADRQRYLEELRVLESWKRRVEEEVALVAQRARSWANAVTSDLSQSAARHLASAEQLLQEVEERLNASYQSVHERFHAYCQGVVARAVTNLKQLTASCWSPRASAAAAR